MSPTTKAQLQIHSCVVLWGFTAILGALITLPSLPLVWWRMLIVVAALALFPRVWRGLAAMPARRMLAYAGIGALVALHWLCFYGAIKLANASVAATCIALATAFTALVEPWLAGSRFSFRNLALGIAVLPGIALVVGGVQPDMRLGIAVATVAAFLVAIFGSLNKRMAHGGDPMTITAVELGSGAIVLTALAPLMPHLGPQLGAALGGNAVFVLPDAHDMVYLLVLALFCTLLPFAVSLAALRHISAFAAQLAINMEPVYAVTLGAWLLGDQHELTPRFYAGVAIILAAVFVYPLVTRPRRVRHPEMLAISEGKSVAE